MKIYKLVDGSFYQDMPNEVIGYFSTIEKAEEAKEDVEEYISISNQVAINKTALVNKFQQYKEENPIDRCFLDNEEENHYQTIMTKISLAETRYRGEARTEEVEECIQRYQITAHELANKRNARYDSAIQGRNKSFLYTLSEKELKVFNYRDSGSFELPLEIIEIELDEYQPMNISELKELV